MPVALSAMIVGLAGLLIWFGNPAVAFLIGAAIAIAGGAKGLNRHPHNRPIQPANWHRFIGFGDSGRATPAHLE